METTTPFDLNRAIQQWRENLGQSPAFRSENLYELETHLRDSISKLQEGRLSPEEAFMVAERRIGRSYALEVEFGKMNLKNVWLDRILWMLIGVQTWSLVSNFTNSITRSALSLAWRNVDQVNSPNGLSGLAFPVILSALAQIVVLAASVALCWWIILRKGPEIRAWMNKNLSCRATAVKTCVRVCFLVLVAHFISLSLQVLPSRYVPPVNLSRTAMFISYSHFFVWPLQTIATVVFILVLARKRLCGSQA